MLFRSEPKRESVGCRLEVEGLQQSTRPSKGRESNESVSSLGDMSDDRRLKRLRLLSMGEPLALIKDHGGSSDHHALSTPHFGWWKQGTRPHFNY
ncbi:hypothetical protein Agabi119p4_7840 [Agaricus bisporus var. burnettii]|uniref:Uncharacterized protein n=1 Tax=Agaricus bisporus var. burnettii TaxID=192524 RepID=A0A8H7C7V6_AGABI|nr:hypothetical protein Agabi119p4_7840 [Agaricus bisporus var. burnettii]